ncbi:putative reverse transcriptase domain-containing protein [Tanacetum coccineum]
MYTTSSVLVRVLSSFDVALYSEATLEDLKTKHPFYPTPSLPHIPTDHHHLIASSIVVLDRIKSFPRGTSCGRDGLRAQHLMDCLSGAAVAVSDELVSSITQVVNLFLVGNCPQILGEYIASAPLTPLVKPGGGIRPIDIGTVWRRLVSKVAGRSEAILHFVNRLIVDYGDDVGLSMLLVDLKNAFNLVDPEVMLREVRLCCPAISRWVEFCYSNPARLYYGEHTLWSCQRVQQGDPLSPLLFSLVLHPLTCKIMDFFSLSLHAWYLDDGIIVGDTVVGGKVLELIMEDGSGCSLHLNVDKTEVFFTKERPSKQASRYFPHNIARPLHGVKLLGTHDLGVATIRALAYAGVMTSGDARSWCVVNQVVLHDALRALVDMLLVVMLIKDVSLVMSTPAHFDSEISSQTVRAQSSRVPTQLPDDPYVAVRQTHLVDTDTESEPEEAPLEIEEFRPLVSRAPLTDEEFEVSEPSDTRITSSHSSASSDSTEPLSPDRLLTQASPTPTPTQVSFHHRTARMARYRSSYETPSPSPTLLVRKRYRGIFELILDTKIEDESSDSDAEREGLEDEGYGLEDKSPGTEEEEATPEGQQQAVPVVDTTADEPLRLGYGALRRRELALGEGSMPSTFEVGHISRSVSEQQRVEETRAPRIPTPTSPEWSSGSLPVSPSSLIVPSPIASLVTTPAATISVDEDQFLEVGAQLELHESILHDHTQCLDALPPTLFEGYDRDLTELYTR